MNSLQIFVFFACAILCSGRRLKCGPAETTLIESKTTLIESETTSKTIETSSGTHSEASTTIASNEVVCPDCDIGLTDSFVNYVKKMFDNHGPSDGVCLASNQKISFPGLAFGYSYDICCCVPQAAPIDCSLPGQTICPPTPGIGPFENLGSYFNRTESILANAPENGCCNFGTVQLLFFSFFTGLPKDICTCLDFTKAIDFSV